MRSFSIDLFKLYKKKQKKRAKGQKPTSKIFTRGKEKILSYIAGKK